MPIRNLLVAFDGMKGGMSSLRLGLTLAAKHGAHVTGAFAYEGPRVLSAPSRLATRGLSREFRNIADRIEAQEREAITRLFHEATEDRLPEDHLTWLDLKGRADTAITEIGRYFDLTLIGASAATTDSSPHAARPDVVALRSGKPVLIVPGNWPEDRQVGHRVVVAWDGQRAAARALGDAIDLLSPFDEISIVSVGLLESEDDFLARQLRFAIERHGMTPHFIIEKATRSVAKVITKVCEAGGADLLVMGAYEHSKFSEDLIGGTTNDILRDLRIPVLMAH